MSMFRIVLYDKFIIVIINLKYLFYISEIIKICTKNIYIIYINFKFIMLSYIPCIYSLSFNVVIYFFWFMKFISKALIWSYYFSYKCIKNLNVQHNDMAILYNNSSFFQTFSKPKMFDFFCIKHIFL